MNQVKREVALEALEKLQINKEIAEGKTPHEIANSGLTGVINPSVLK